MPNIPALRDAALARSIDHLASHGWCQYELFLPAALTLALAAECRHLSASGALTPAAVGRAGAQAVRPEIRGDSIRWLEIGQTAACDTYLGMMDSLRRSLNRALFLGLDEYESHFACYAPGAAYARHVDRFQDDDSRTVSAVIYLNPAWLTEEGGVLRLYPDAAPSEDIAPMGARLVLFLSAQMPHEVLPATRERLSLAGWFRRRPG